MNHDASSGARSARSAAASYRRWWLPDLLVLVVLMAATAAVFGRTRLDLAVAGRFFDAAALPDKPFSTHRAALWEWLRAYGWLPAVLAALGAFALLLGSARRPAWRAYRLHALFLLLALALGPGVVVNQLFKEHWGRPRPVQVREFGGRWDYRPPLVKGLGGKGKSFPCGHSSVGYYLCAFYFLFRRRRPRAAFAALAVSVAYGSLVGYARMLAGAHFLSDVLWSGYMVFLVCWCLYYFVLRVPAREDRLMTGLGGRGAMAISTILFAGILGGILLATPYYREINRAECAVPSEGAPATFVIDAPEAEVFMTLSEEPLFIVRGTAEGFGWPGSRAEYVLEEAAGDRAGTWRFRMWETGWFSELKVRLRVCVPAARAGALVIRMPSGDVVVGPDGAAPVSLRIASGEAAVSLPACWRGTDAAPDLPPGRLEFRAAPMAP